MVRRCALPGPPARSAASRRPGQKGECHVCHCEIVRRLALVRRFCRGAGDRDDRWPRRADSLGNRVPARHQQQWRGRCGRYRWRGDFRRHADDASLRSRCERHWFGKYRCRTSIAGNWRCFSCLRTRFSGNRDRQHRDWTARNCHRRTLVSGRQRLAGFGRFQHRVR